MWELLNVCHVNSTINLQSCNTASSEALAPHSSEDKPTTADTVSATYKVLLLKLDIKSGVRTQWKYLEVNCLHYNSINIVIDSLKVNMVKIYKESL